MSGFYCKYIMDPKNIFRVGLTLTVFNFVLLLFYRDERLKILDGKIRPGPCEKNDDYHQEVEINETTVETQKWNDL